MYISLASIPGIYIVLPIVNSPHPYPYLWLDFHSLCKRPHPNCRGRDSRCRRCRAVNPRATLTKPSIQLLSLILSVKCRSHLFPKYQPYLISSEFCCLYITNFGLKCPGRVVYAPSLTSYLYWFFHAHTIGAPINPFSISFLWKNCLPCGVKSTLTDTISDLVYQSFVSNKPSLLFFA